MDVLTKEQRRKNMQAIKSHDTVAERLLAKALWAKGFRYRKNVKSIFGKPDLVFRRLKIAVFVDGEYFHGRNWEKNKFRIKTNNEFWWAKIESNILRDQEVTYKLTKDKWIVLRFWETDIKKHLADIVIKVENTIQKSEQEIKYREKINPRN